MYFLCTILYIALSISYCYPPVVVQYIPKTVLSVSSRGVDGADRSRTPRLLVEVTALYVHSTLILVAVRRRGRLENVNLAN